MVTYMQICLLRQSAYFFMFSPSFDIVLPVELYDILELWGFIAFLFFLSISWISFCEAQKQENVM